MITPHRSRSLSGFRAVGYYATVGYQRPYLHAPGLRRSPSPWTTARQQRRCGATRRPRSVRAEVGGPAAVSRPIRRAWPAVGWGRRQVENRLRKALDEILDNGFHGHDPRRLPLLIDEGNVPGAIQAPLV